jgi:hypothetical protein
VNEYALTDFSTNYSDASQECAQAHTNTLMPMENKNIHDYNFNMLSALKRNYKLFNVHIFICCGRAFVRHIIFTGGLLSAKSFLRDLSFLSALSLFDGRAFVREGFCLTFHFKTSLIYSSKLQLV